MRSFIEKDLINITHSKEKGWGGKIGNFLWGNHTTLRDEVIYSFRTLSLYEYSVVKINPTEETHSATNFWILKLLLGNYITKEYKVREECILKKDHSYIVTKYLRVEGYFTLKYLFPWLNEKTEVYLVSSSTDKELHGSTFFLPEWVRDQRRPSANEVINQAKKLYKLVESFKL